jgi:hypothetical protein
LETKVLHEPLAASGTIRRAWQEWIDLCLYVALVALLVASTMNGLSVDWAVLGTEVTIRPDQVVLLFLLPTVALAFVLSRLRFHVTLFDGVVLAFIFSNAASSILVSHSPKASLQGTLLLGMYATMYFVVRQILADRAEWLPRVGNWLLGLGVVQAVYSLTALVLYSRGYVLAGLHRGHLTETSVAIRGTFPEPNLLGAYLSLIAVFLTVRYVFRPEGQRGGTWLFGLFLTSLALPLTVTRAAGLAFALGMLALAVIVGLYRREIPGWSARAGKVVVTLGCVVLLTVTAMNGLVSTLSRYPNLLLERWISIALIAPGQDARLGEEGARTRAERSSMTEAQKKAPAIEGEALAVGRNVTEASRSSVEGRLNVWLRALERWRESPILGHGTLAGGGMTQQGWWYSSLVQAFYDTGLLGFFVLLWIHLAAIFYPMRAWLRTSRNPMSANLLGFGVGNAVLLFTSQFSSFLFLGFPWVFWGLSMGAVEAHATGRLPEMAKPSSSVRS